MRRLAFVVLLSGCSFIGVEGPKKPNTRKKPCTDDYSLPIFDTVMATGATIGTVAVASMDNHPGAVINAQALALPPLILSALFYGASAGSGYSKVSACRSTPVVDIATPPSRDARP